MDLDTLLHHRDFVRALARSLVADPHGADDAAQEAIVAALRNGPRAEGDLRGWFARVIVNIRKNAVRGAARRAERELRIAKPNRIPSTADVVAHEELRRRVVAAVLALEDPYRSAVLARYFNQLAPRAIASELGIPAATVHTRLKRALQLLRTRLGPETLLSLAPLAAAPPLFRSPLSAAAGAVVATKTNTLLITGAAAAIALAVGFVGIPLLRQAWQPKPRGNDVVALAQQPSTSTHPAPAAPESASARAAAATSTPQIRGRVVDRDGRALAGARVVAYADTFTRPLLLGEIGAPSSGARATTCDSDGRFTIAIAGEAPLYCLYADATGGYLGSNSDVRAGDDVTIIAEHCGAIVGVVRNRDGEPVPNVTVEFRALLEGLQIGKSARTDAEGRYRIEGAAMPPGRLAAPGNGWNCEGLFATAPGFAPTFMEFLKHPANAADMEQDIYITRGATIRGRVFDAETTLPIANARVVCGAHDSYWGRGLRKGRDFIPHFTDRTLCETKSNAEGVYEIANIPVWGGYAEMHGMGYLYIGCTPEGYVPRSDTLRQLEDQPDSEGGVVVESKDFDLDCWRAGAIRGRIVDDRQAPIANTKLWIKTLDVSRGAWSWFYWGIVHPTHWADTDDKGTYAIPFVATTSAGPNRVQLSIEEQQTGFAHSELTVEARRGEWVTAPDLVVARVPARNVDVRVVDIDGKPIWGASVGPINYREELTDRDGRVLLRLPIPSNTTGQRDPFTGPFAIVAKAAGYAPETSDPLTVEPNGTQQLRLVLRRPTTLSGRVVDTNGAAVRASVQVGNGSLAFEDVFSRQVIINRNAPTAMKIYGGVQSGPDGVFEFTNIPPGPYHISAQRMDYGGRAFEARLSGVATGARDVVLVLPAEQPKKKTGGMITGRALDAETKRPLLHFYVNIPSADGGADFGGGNRRDLAPGLFQYEDIPPGTYELVLRAEGYAPRKLENVGVASEKTTGPLTILVDRGAILRGTVRGEFAEGAPANVYFEDSEAGRSIGGAEVTNGHFEKPALAPGAKVVMTASPKGGNAVYLLSGAHAIAQSVYTIPKDRAIIDEEFTLVSAYKVAVLAKCARRGSQSSLSQKEQYELDGASRLEVRDEKGGVVLQRNYFVDRNYEIWLAAGTYTIRAEVPGAPSQEKAVVVSGGALLPVEFSLP